MIEWLLQPLGNVDFKDVQLVLQSLRVGGDASWALSEVFERILAAREALERIQDAQAAVVAPQEGG
jgi:hypothetical protein